MGWVLQSGYRQYEVDSGYLSVGGDGIGLSVITIYVVTRCNKRIPSNHLSMMCYIHLFIQSLMLATCGLYLQSRNE